MRGSTVVESKKPSHNKEKYREFMIGILKRKRSSTVLHPKKGIISSDLTDRRLYDRLMALTTAYKAKLERGAKISQILQACPEILLEALTPSDTRALKLFLSHEKREIRSKESNKRRGRPKSTSLMKKKSNADRCEKHTKTSSEAVKETSECDNSKDKDSKALIAASGAVIE